MDSHSSQRDWDALHILIGGILGMIIAMGIGRFAFTPIIPLMQRDLGMSNSVVGWLAGLNYLGYLAGAVLCSFAPVLLRLRLVAASSLFLSIVTTGAMGLTLSVFWWGSMRFVGGLASAMLFIIISAEVGEALTRRGYGHWVGALYGGIGVGIALSGLLVPWLDHFWQWDGAWISMGGLSIILAVAGLSLRGNKVDSPDLSGTTQSRSKSLLSLWPLVVAYFFEGLGYIVTATFIVAIVGSTPGLEAYGAYSWVVLGLAASPSTVLWPFLSRRIGQKKALLAAYAVQASGILVSIYADTIIEVLYSAIAFGGTFLGIVAMTLAEGNVRMKEEGKRAAAILTASFGVGQILGPILGGVMADMQEGFSLPLLLAAACIMIGWGFTAIDRNFMSAER